MPRRIGVVGPLKTCSDCGDVKTLEGFYRRGNGRAFGWCKKCWGRKTRARASSQPEAVREYNLRRNYGISSAEYERMLVEQHAVCAICGDGPRADGPSRTQRLYVDHDHATGRVRQLLCFLCNAALGGFRDDPKLLAVAIEYLNRWGE